MDSVYRRHYLDSHGTYWQDIYDFAIKADVPIHLVPRGPLFLPDCSPSF